MTTFLERYLQDNPFCFAGILPPSSEGKPSSEDNLTPIKATYFTPEQLAEELGISMRTLMRWHAERRGPPRCAVGKLILYRVAAVHDWLASQESDPVRLQSGRTRMGRAG